MNRRERQREWLLLGATVGFVVTLLLSAELLLGYLDPGYVERARDNSVDRLNQYSEAYGWAPRPFGRARERGLETSLNARGQRGPEVPEAHGARPRLLLLGDSTAFGYGVAEEQTYARRVDAAPNGFEVVNLGVLGYGPDQALLKLEREGLAYAPDVVVMSLCVDNDFADARSPVYLYDGRHPKPYFTLEGEQIRLHDEHLRLGARERLGLWLAGRSQLYLRALSLVSAGGTVEAWRSRRDKLLADQDAAVELVAALLERMGALSAEHKARFLVIAHPSKDSYNRGSALWDALHARLAGRVGTLDLAQGYRERGLRFSDLALDPTGHLSPAGHAAAAELLLRRLREP